VGLGTTAGSEGGTQVGKYRLLRRIAAGGMAEVYLATDDGKQLWAVKLILAHLADQPEFLGLFLDEARLASVINHPNVARVRDMGMEDGRLFLAMEYARGQPLSALIGKLREKGKALEPAQAAAILAQAAAGLNAAHDAKARDGSPMELVHRDVSPQNLLLTEDGFVKVVDFGIAKARNKLVVTQVNTTRGKPWYMSPEQMRGEPLDRRADIFSLGAVLFELLLGTRLFEGDVDQVMYKALNEPLPDILEVKPDVPAELAAMVGRACARKPDDRFETAWEMEQELLAFAKQQGGAGDLGALVRDNFPRMPATVDEVLGPGAPRDSNSRPALRSGGLNRVVSRPPTSPGARSLSNPNTEITRPPVKVRRPGAMAEAPTVGEAPPDEKTPSDLGPEPVPPPAPVTASTALPPDAAVEAAPPKSKKGLIIGIAAAVGFALLGGGSAWFMASREAKPKPLAPVAAVPKPALIPATAVKPPANPFAALDDLPAPDRPAPKAAAPLADTVDASAHLRISCSETCTIYLDGSAWSSAAPGNPVDAPLKPGRHSVAASLGNDGKPKSARSLSLDPHEVVALHFGHTDGKYLVGVGNYSYEGEARGALRRGDWAKAVRNFRMALSLSPSVAALHRDLGEALAHTGSTSEAKFQLETYLYLAKDPKDGDEVRARVRKLAGDP